MQSRWVDQKETAICMRQEGQSIRSIEIKLGIPRSTLSYWFRNITLNASQQAILQRKWREGMRAGRQKASVQHRVRKEERIKAIQNKVISDLIDIDSTNPQLLEIALAFLYLGEGSKTKRGLGLGNSNPMVICFYLDSLEILYGIDRNTLRVELHIRMDQDAETLKEYWSRKIKVPVEQFRYVLRDKRTAGKATYPGYPGVCAVDGGGVEIQRRLMYLAKEFCIGLTCAVSSVG